MEHNIPILFFEKGSDWEEWLRTHTKAHDGVWLKIAKKDTGVTSVSHGEALDVALCYGWIDGLRRGLDATYFLQKFTPRRPRSLWSKVNIAKTEQLIAAGRMRTEGLAEIEAAKADGRWEAAYESQKSAQLPPDFLEELHKHPRAHAFFETLNSANRYAVFWRLTTAKKPETRARRLQKIIEQLNRQEKFH